MAILGALAVTIDQVEIAAKANAELESKKDVSISDVISSMRHGGITHHYKSTTTHQDTVEINEADGSSSEDLVKAETKAGKTKKSHCGCFGKASAKKK